MAKAAAKKTKQFTRKGFYANDTPHNKTMKSVQSWADRKNGGGKTAKSKKPLTKWKMAGSGSGSGRNPVGQRKAVFGALTADGQLWKTGKKGKRTKSGK